MWGTREGLGIGERNTKILDPQGLQRLEAEYVADDRRGDVGYRALLEQVDVIGDVGVVLVGLGGNREDPVALGLISVEVHQVVGPHCCPGGGG
jgi:hypothetical protein